MAIKPSASAEVRSLITALDAEDPTRREAAVARLAVIGARAVDRLIARYAAAPPRTRVAILRALEAIGDPRALPVARAALGEGGDVAVAAAGALRPLLDSSSEHVAAEALDTLISVALPPDGPRPLRLAAFAALRDIPAGLAGRLTTALAEDPDPVVRAAVSDRKDASAAAEWREALEGRLGEDSAPLLIAVETEAPRTALGDLQKLIDRVRAREKETAGQEREGEWRALRGRLHQGLAERGSRVALYDLRESIADAAGPLPRGFCAALTAIGDASCLDGVAAAYSASGDADWRRELAAALQAIVEREKLTPRSAPLKRLAARWPDAAALVSKPSRTTPRPRRTGRT